MISVCMATYNGSRYLKQQVESILCQLAADDEIIVSDDGSTDDTLSILADFNDPRIKTPPPMTKADACSPILQQL